MFSQVISAITPRPIAFISSQSSDGVVNVSPYSYFNVMSHDPIHITIGEDTDRPDFNGSDMIGFLPVHREVQMFLLPSPPSLGNTV